MSESGVRASPNEISLETLPDSICTEDTATPTKAEYSLPTKRPRSNSRGKYEGMLIEKCRCILLLKSNTLKDCCKKVRKSKAFVKNQLEIALCEQNFYTGFLVKMQSVLKSKSDIEFQYKLTNINRELSRSKRTFSNCLFEVEAILKAPYTDETTIDKVARWLSIFDLKEERKVFLGVLESVKPQYCKAFWLDLMQYFPFEYFQLTRRHLEQTQSYDSVGPIFEALCLHLAKSNTPELAIEYFGELFRNPLLGIEAAAALYTEMFLMLPSNLHTSLFNLHCTNTETTPKFLESAAKATEMMLERGLESQGNALLSKLLLTSEKDMNMLDKLLDICVKFGYTAEVSRIQNLLNPSVILTSTDQLKDLFVKFTEDVLDCLNSTSVSLCRAQGCVKSNLRRLTREVREKLGLSPSNRPVEEILIEEGVQKHQSAYIYSMHMDSSLLYKTDIATGFTWTLEAKNIYFKSGSQYCEVRENTLVVTGGQDSDEAFEIDVANDCKVTWLDPMTCVRYNHGTCCVDEIIYVIGGQLENKKLRLCERLNKGRWETKSALPEPISCISPIAIERTNCIYLFGGNSSSYLDIIHKYDIERDLWIRLPTKMFRKAHYVPCFVTKDSALDIYFISQNYLSRFNTSKEKVRDVRTLDQDVYCYQGRSRYRDGKLFCSRLDGASRPNVIGFLN